MLGKEVHTHDGQTLCVLRESGREAWVIRLNVERGWYAELVSPGGVLRLENGGQ